jgi:hypothetical protein
MAVAAYLVSNAAGGLLASWLVDAAGALWPGSAAAERYRVALFAGALLSASGIPLVALVREPRATPAVAAPGNRRPRPVPRVAVGDRWGSTAAWLRAARHAAAQRRLARVVGCFVLADVLIRFGGNLVLPFMNVFFVHELRAGEAWFGALRATERALVVAGTLSVAPVATRLGPVATVVLTQLLSVPLLLILGVTPMLQVASVAYVLRGMLMEMTVPTRDNFLMDVLPQQARTAANSVLQLSGYAVAWVALRTGGHVFQSWGFAAACAITGGLYVLSAVLYWSFFRALPQAAPGRRLELAPASV